MFDPVLSISERDYISTYMDVLPDNDMCCRRVVSNTLFYMIHSRYIVMINITASTFFTFYSSVDNQMFSFVLLESRRLAVNQ